jgi:hypothetical protein
MYLISVDLNDNDYGRYTNIIGIVADEKSAIDYVESRNNIYNIVSEKYSGLSSEVRYISSKYFHLDEDVPLLEAREIEISKATKLWEKSLTEEEYKVYSDPDFFLQPVWSMQFVEYLE